MKNCNHTYDELVPSYCDGYLEAADVVVCCHLIGCAEIVLNGWATFGQPVVDEHGLHLELLWND